jgi:LPXTG-motif cell wall-anchored protein
MRSVTKLFLSGVIVVAGLGAFSGVAAAQQGYPFCTIDVSLVQGRTLLVTGENFPDGPVDIFFDDTQVGTTVAASAISFEFDIPQGTPDGMHEVTAISQTDPDQVCSANIRIETTTPGGGGGAGGGRLAFTGSSNTNLAAVGIGALALGGVMVMAIRRRTRSSISAG